MGIKHRGRDPLDLLWPDTVRIYPDCVELGQKWARSYVVVGFPRAVGPGWFEPLLRFGAPMTIDLYNAPVENEEALGQLNRRLLWNRGIQEAAKAQGLLARPDQDTAIEDAERLRASLVRGDHRLLEVGLYLTVFGQSRDELEDNAKLLESLARGMLLVLRRLRYQQDQGIRRTLPLGEYPEKRREMDSRAWATLFPFTSQDIIHPHGQALGINPRNQSWIIVDRFQLASPHSITIGWSGAGKSFAAKLEAIRTRYRGIAVTIVDPEGEYVSLGQVGARVFRLGHPGASLPFDPFIIPGDKMPEEIDREGDFLLRFLARLDPDFGRRWGEELRQAIWRRIAPGPGGVDPSGDDVRVSPQSLMADLAPTDPHAAQRLGDAVNRWRMAAPALAQDEPCPFEVYDLSGLSERMKGAAYLAVTEGIARGVGRSKRLVIFDEAWHLLNNPDTVPYLEELFRRARKWGTALALVTQDISDFTRHRAAEVCLRNAPLVFLMRQHPESMAEVATLLRLHEGEIQTLETVGRGEGLLLVEDSHVPMKVMASAGELEVLAEGGRGKDVETAVVESP